MEKFRGKIYTSHSSGVKVTPLREYSSACTVEIERRFLSYFNKFGFL